MTFILQAPGIRDEIKLSNLFEQKVVRPVDAAVRVRHIDTDIPIEHVQRYGRDRIRQAYEEGDTRHYKELTAAQLMSSPVMTLPLGTSLDAAWRFFRQHRFRHVPIINAQGQLQGIVSDRDMLRTFEQMVESGGTSADSKPVENMMKERVLTATSDTVISQIAGVFFQQRIGSMPIVDQDKLVGIITRSDILGAMVYSSPTENWA